MPSFGPIQQTFFSRPSIDELRDGSGRVLRPPAIVGRTGDVIDHGMLIAPLLDRVTEDLVRHGYGVLRIPLLATGIDEPGPISGSRPEAESPADPDAYGEDQQDRSSPEPGYPLLIYNDVLLKRDGDTRTVYLPRCGWTTLDRAARRIRHAAGYRVVPVPGLTTSAMNGGSLRCCVKVLRRTAG